MPEMSLSEAALWAGKGRPAILKAIQKGTISASKDDAGQWRIDPSELARVYPPGNKPDRSESIARSFEDIAEATAGKDRELALMREMLDETRRDRDDWKAEAGKWQEQAEASGRLLTHEQQKPPPGQALATTEPAGEGKPEAPRRGMLGRLFGRR